MCKSRDKIFLGIQDQCMFGSVRRAPQSTPLGVWKAGVPRGACQTKSDFMGHEEKEFLQENVSCGLMG
jgi:hypothetical protein